MLELLLYPQVLFSNGTIVSITIALNCADIEKISIDKSLVGKISDQIHNGRLKFEVLELKYLIIL